MKAGVYTSSLPPISERRDEIQKKYLPIRSITYKKRTDDSPNIRIARPNHVSLSGLRVPPISSSFVQARTNDTSLEKSPGAMTERILNKSNLAYEFQKLRNSKTTRCETERETVASSPMRSRVIKSRIMRIPNSASSVAVSTDLSAKHHDYFQLLFDKSRKGFNVSEFEGTDEYYTKDMVMSRIYDQGFRHPDYYAKANRFKEMRAPDEYTIKSGYALKIAPWVNPLENVKTEATYLLGGGANNANYIENVVNSVNETRARFLQEKEDLRKEMDNMMKGWGKELEMITKVYGQKMKGVDDIIKNNSVAMQTEKFKMQKEIVKLQRDKLKMEKEIEEAIHKINGFEDKMYGQPIFILEPVNEFLDTISERNLRLDHSHVMRNKPIIH